MNATAESAAPALTQPVASLGGLALRLTRQWWRQLAALAAACGVVAATISGALGVGAAVEQGLLRLALERLGGIEAAVVGEDFLRSELAGELAVDAAGRIVPALVVEAVVETPADGKTGARRTRAVVLGCDGVAALGFAGPSLALASDQVAVNAPLAAALGVEAGKPLSRGAPLVLRIAERSVAPADSPLGRRDLRSVGRRVTAGAVLPQEGLGRFALEPAQVTRPLVVAPLALVQRLVDRGDVANAIFAVAGGAPAAAWGDAATASVDAATASVDTAAALRARLTPALEDFGLSLAAAASDPPSMRLTSRRLILAPEVDTAAAEILAPLGGRPSLVFLATTISGPRAEPAGQPAAVPYSTILGIDATSLPVGDIVDADGKTLPLPGLDEIVIDRWLADDFAAQGSPVAVGDTLEIAFFLPETVHGRVEESRARLRVTAIAEMRGAAVDRSLVPEVEGVSDEDSIADWDPPFPFDASRVRTTPPHDEDDRYWKDHGTTPKAFVSLATARRIAGSRFGRTTAWHVPRASVDDPAVLARRLAAAIRPEAAGLRVVSLAAEARAAARGSTPFGPLFLALSSFIVMAGLLLEWLLFRLLVTARRREIGILAATGWPPRRLATLLTLVGGVVAIVGSVIGAAVGPAWAALLLERLGRAWTSAVAGGDVPALGAATGAARPIPAALVASIVISLAALAWLAARTARLRPLALLRGGAEAPSSGRGGRVGGGRAWLVVGAAVLAVALAATGLGATPELAVASFFVAGGAALVALVTAAHRWLVAPGAGVVMSLARLARRSVAANPARALAVIAIVAIAEFLVVALSAFELGPPPVPTDVRSPTGGWTTIASFGTPVSADSAAELPGAEIALLRSSGGSDASCTNLYAATRPAVLGVGAGFIARKAFSFVAHAPLPAGEHNPWTLLDRSPGAAGPIPAILDQATAQWALKVGGVGARFTVPDDDGADVVYEVVGLLAPGILQGSVLIAEQAFEAAYPQRSGYGLALLAVGSATNPAELDRQAAAVWADAGVLLEPAVARLARLAAVQNTFLAGFQTLGLLGLLLGTAGVAAVQAQGVLERLGQFGLLGALGFAADRVRMLVVTEAVLLVGAGLAAGAVAGLIALAPALAAGRAALPTWWIVVTCGLTLAAAAGAGMVAARQATQVNPRDALRSA
jgi:hypothetical protein